MSEPALTVADRQAAEAIAKLFHDTYERLAPDFGYETRKDSAVPWEQVPEKNRNLMIAVASKIRQRFFGVSEAYQMRSSEEKLLDIYAREYANSFLEYLPLSMHPMLMSAFVAAIMKAEKRGIAKEWERLIQGKWSPGEFQMICHNMHERGTPCTRAEFEQGCRDLTEQLFGPVADRTQVRPVFPVPADYDGTDP